MSRAEFMEKLEYLLQDLSQEDREDGIAFYRDYLDEAGTERELLDVDTQADLPPRE